MSDHTCIECNESADCWIDDSGSDIVDGRVVRAWSSCATGAYCSDCLPDFAAGLECWGDFHRTSETVHRNDGTAVLRTRTVTLEEL